MNGLHRFGRFLDAESIATGLPLRSLLIVALAIHIWVTLLSVNPLHPDEHFQVLEFAWARAGLSSPEALPWEWAAQIRPALQPALAGGLLQVLSFAGFDSPFLWVLVLRMASFALACTVLLAIFARESPSLDRRGRQTLWITGLFLWIAPLFLARFTSENAAGLALAAAIVRIETGSGLTTGTRRLRNDAVAGALLGLSFVFRFPMAMAIVPVLVWVAVQRGAGAGKRSVRRALAMSLCAGLVAVAGGLLDSWFYGTAVVTPWNYFVANLLDGKAASFGTSPWYAYLHGMPLWLAPPVGVALTLLAIGGLAARPRSLWTWAVLPFVLGHSLIAHKEVRFLLPMLYAMPVLVARGTAFVPVGRASRATVRILLLQNALLLMLVATPALHRGREFDMHYVHWLWDLAERHPGETVYVLEAEGRPYRMWNLENNVYRHPRVRGVAHRPGDPIPSFVPAGTPPDRLLVVARGTSVPWVADARVNRLVYQAEPGYRAMAQAAGLADAAWLRWLEARDGWTDAGAVRRVYQVRLEGRE